MGGGGDVGWGEEEEMKGGGGGDEGWGEEEMKGGGRRR